MFQVLSMLLETRAALHQNAQTMVPSNANTNTNNTSKTSSSNNN